MGSVLAASPSALPRGQKKSTADANSQAHKGEGKNNHPVIDCSLMESINLWPQKSQLICGQWCLKDKQSTLKQTHIIPPYWCHAFILGRLQHFQGNGNNPKHPPLSVTPIRVEVSLSYLIWTKWHKDIKTCKASETLMFFTVWAVRGEKF